MNVFQNKFFIDPVTGAVTLLSKLLGFVLSLLIFIVAGYFLWDLAGDSREEEVVARYEALAIKDKEAKLTNFTVGKELFETKTKETEIKYVDRVKEVTKYVASAASAAEATDSCAITPDFIRVYNNSGTSSK
jgi:hypothetical protein